MFIKKNPKQYSNGEYSLIIFLILLFPYLYVVDYDEHKILAGIGIVVLYIISYLGENKIVKISNRRYEKLKNDIKEDVLREVLEELDELENNKKK
tara:strand:+ start:388 stop:672 length:285 start_codon:yes stop_codon:yes gene_type:complete